MAVDYNDERLTAVKAEETQALTENEQTYNNMINSSDGYYKALEQNAADWSEKQQQLQQEQTDFAIEQIEQQKEQAQKDYIKEQSGAYTDWQKQSNKYGVNAEQMAASGLTNTGYSESSQVGMYNTYQNRVAMARESYNQAIQNYNNSITEARLQNNSTLAEIAYEALQQQLELSLPGFQYKNQLIAEQANKKLEIQSFYNTKWQNVLDQINTENALAEEQRQYNETLALQKAQLAQEQAQWEKEYALQQEQYSKIYSTSTAQTAAAKVSAAKQAAREKSGTTVSTKYYSGPIAENVGGFGYMGKDNNGVAYQPKGVYIDGKAYKLSKSGKTAKQMFGSGSTNSSGVNIDNQNVWVANGRYFIWNGTKNAYEEVTSTFGGGSRSF